MKEQIETRVNYFKTHPAALLLILQVAMLAILPQLHGQYSSRLVLASFSIVSMLLAVVVVIRSQAMNVIAIVLGVGSILCTLGSMLNGFSGLLFYGMVLEGLLYSYTAGALIWYMLSDHEVTLDEMFAVGATFTLIGWAFTYFYLALQMVSPQAFTGLRDPSGPRTWVEMVFVSFTNLSATGSGDIMPLTPYARLLVLLEQALGVGYVGVIVSRFIGLTLSGHSRETRRRDESEN